MLEHVCDADRMLYIPTPAVAQIIAPYSVFSDASVQDALATTMASSTTTVAEVPFYSQFKDITSTSWQKVGCGITGLAMIIDYYTPDAVTAEQLLAEGIRAGAYQKNAGWVHAGLISLSSQYGLQGKAYYLGAKSSKSALSTLQEFVQDGPVLASVHYKLDPANPTPHMIVVTSIHDGIVHYNDPAAKAGDTYISTAAFQKAWKQKFIVLRPV